MKNYTWMWVAAALVIGAAGCKNNSGKLSVSAGTAKQTAADAGAATSLDLGNGILVDRVRIVVREIKLEGGTTAADGGVDAGVDAGSTATTMLAARSSKDHGGSGSGDGSGDDGSGHDGDDDGEDHDADEVEVGPFLADMTGADLASGVTEVFDTEVPAGTYHEVKIKIHSVTSGSSSSADAGTSTDPGIAAMNGQTVIVDGTVTPCTTDGGTPGPAVTFSFQTTLSAEQKQEGSITVASDGSTKNITLHVDPATWFGGACPARLDPNDPANADAIRKNIKDSLRVFEDEDHDGCDDHGEHGSGHH